MAAPRPALYKELLTPALHRRFTGAAGTILLVCYVEAVLIGDKSSFFWSWFPIGTAGIRTLLLFISALSIFVLRVAQLHIGARATSSQVETFTKYLFRSNTVQTLAWYFFSAWWFSEVYMWSVPASANLGWISEGKQEHNTVPMLLESWLMESRAWERKKLNERPIYLRSVFFMLATLQSLLHLYYDYDKVLLPPTQSKTESTTEQPQKEEHPLARIKALLPNLAQDLGLRAAGVSILGPIIYALFIRRTAWSCSLWLAELLWDVPASQLSYIPPYHISLILRSLSSGVFLLALWEASNALFGAYVAQEPIKKGQPLTSEAKDPNGALLNGLKSKRGTLRSFAYWELVYISQRFHVRRRAIFSDIDRPTGAAWNQVMTLCLGDILGINNRITAFQNPTATPASVPPQQKTTIESLPRISAPPRQENILRNPPPPSTSRERFESSVGSIAKSYGQSPQPAKPARFLDAQRAETQKYLGAARQKLLTNGQQETLSGSGLLAQYNDYMMRFLRTPVGYPFRQTFRRRVCTAVLGSPYSELKVIVDSANALSGLALASLKEDSYGRVAKDVPLMIRVFVSTITTVEGFVSGLPAHWTDVEFSEADRKVVEVDLILDALKTGLKSMVGAFGQYATELGLGREEISVARKVAGMEEGE